MKRILTLTLVVSLAAASSAFATIEGAWTATPSKKDSSRIQLNITMEPNSNNGMSMPLSAFTGLTSAQVYGTAPGAVQFQLRREAGTATFDGSFRNGYGAGQLTFTGNSQYEQAIRSLGIDFDLERHGRTRNPERMLFELALFDVSTDYIRTMKALGFNETLNKYLEMRIFDITPEYVHEMESLGFGKATARELIDSRIHRVTPEFVRSMRAAGFNLTLRQYQEAGIHGMDVEFANEMRKYGYNRLDFNDLVAFRIHGVTPKFIEELRTLGYTNVDADDLVAMRIHGVTPDFIRRVNNAGYKNVPVSKLVEMRIFNVDPDMLRKLDDAQRSH